MTGQTKLEAPRRKNLICNFRAPDQAKFDRWKHYVAWCNDQGRDVCHVTLSLIDAFMRGVDGSAAASIVSPEQVINLQMNNVFTYEVKRPRRVPCDLSIIKKEHRRTFSSLVFESWVKMKCHTLGREVSYLDFLEMERAAFHRIMRKLLRKGEMLRNPIRTVPQYYFLPELIDLYRPIK